ncbi:MAG: twin-arginine translocase TatA/TatE family subunit [Proteobacteria bacterium]|nr:twin-arginine translocase TatA/TatE family subunit [Pseudomonadota bacterium]
MFNIGFGEFAIIALILIVAVGPEKLPAMMKVVGKTLRQFRRASDELRSAIALDELMRDDLTSPPRSPPLPEPPKDPVARHEGPTELDTEAPAQAGPARIPHEQVFDEDTQVFDADTRVDSGAAKHRSAPPASPPPGPVSPARAAPPRPSLTAPPRPARVPDPGRGSSGHAHAPPATDAGDDPSPGGSSDG